MKKTRKWSSLILAAFTVLSLGACEDWGQMDPPAGNDVNPKLEQVANVTFQGDFDPTSMNYYAYEGGEIAEIVVDEERDTVLHCPNGYARMFNPLSNYKVQNGVSLTFWVKQAVLVDEETQEALDDDLEGALFSFQNANGTQRMFMTANGWLKYEGTDGEYEANNPSNLKTGMLTPAGEWHYVAITVRNDGYSVFVDGNQRIDKTETDFDFNKIVQFMGNTSYIYIGSGSDTDTREMWIDDINIYRNQITSKEQARPSMGGEEPDYGNYLNVGAEDCSSAWWTTFSPSILMTGDTNTHYGFWNYGSGGGNWNNFVLVITNGKERDESGYAEYVVIRSDAFGWGQYWVDGRLTHNLNFDTFIADMNGAFVDIDIVREGNKVTVKTCATTSDGRTLIQEYWFEGDLAETIGSFLACDASYYKIDVEKTLVGGKVYAEETYTIGAPDCSTGWWTQFSDLSVVTGDTDVPFVHAFYNYSSMAANWSNWVIVITNGKNRDESGYAEYAVLRADAYGWGAFGNTNDNADLISLTHSFNWDTFKEQMNGAFCRVAVERKDADLTITVKTRSAAGEVLGDIIFTYPNGITTPDIGIFFTVDGSYLDFRSVGYMPFWSEIQQ